MKLRRFTDKGVAKTRAYLAAVKESNDVDNVTLDGAPFARATLLSSPDYSDAIPARVFHPPQTASDAQGAQRVKWPSGRNHQLSKSSPRAPCVWYNIYRQKRECV